MGMNFFKRTVAFALTMAMAISLFTMWSFAEVVNDSEPTDQSFKDVFYKDGSSKSEWAMYDFTSGNNDYASAIVSQLDGNKYLSVSPKSTHKTSKNIQVYLGPMTAVGAVANMVVEFDMATPSIFYPSETRLFVRASGWGAKYFYISSDLTVRASDARDVVLAQLTAKEWHHFSLTFDALNDVGYLYVNGELVGRIDGMTGDSGPVTVKWAYMLLPGGSDVEAGQGVCIDNLHVYSNNPNGAVPVEDDYSILMPVDCEALVDVERYLVSYKATYVAEGSTEAQKENAFFRFEQLIKRVDTSKFTTDEGKAAAAWYDEYITTGMKNENTEAFLGYYATMSDAGANIIDRNAAANEAKKLYDENAAAEEPIFNMENAELVEALEGFTALYDSIKATIKAESLAALEAIMQEYRDLSTTELENVTERKAKLDEATALRNSGEFDTASQEYIDLVAEITAAYALIAQEELALAFLAEVEFIKTETNAITDRYNKMNAVYATYIDDGATTPVNKDFARVAEAITYLDTNKATITTLYYNYLYCDHITKSQDTSLTYQERYDHLNAAAEIYANADATNADVIAAKDTYDSTYADIETATFADNLDQVRALLAKVDEAESLIAKRNAFYKVDDFIASHSFGVDSDEYKTFYDDYTAAKEAFQAEVDQGISDREDNVDLDEYSWAVHYENPCDGTISIRVANQGKGDVLPYVVKPTDGSDPYFTIVNKTGKTNPFFEVSLYNMPKGSIVCEFDVTSFTKLPRKFDFFSALTAANGTRQFPSFFSLIDGDLVANVTQPDGTVQSNVVLAEDVVQLGEWTRFAIVMKGNTFTIDVYFDDILVYADLPYPDYGVPIPLIRFSYPTTTTDKDTGITYDNSNSDIAFKDIKVYSGSIPRDVDRFNRMTTAEKFEYYIDNYLLVDSRSFSSRYAAYDLITDLVDTVYKTDAAGYDKAYGRIGAIELAKGLYATYKADIDAAVAECTTFDEIKTAVTTFMADKADAVDTMITEYIENNLSDVGKDFASDNVINILKSDYINMLADVVADEKLADYVSSATSDLTAIQLAFANYMIFDIEPIYEQLVASNMAKLEELADALEVAVTISEREIAANTMKTFMNNNVFDTTATRYGELNSFLNQKLIGIEADKAAEKFIDLIAQAGVTTSTAEIREQKLNDAIDLYEGNTINKDYAGVAEAYAKIDGLRAQIAEAYRQERTAEYLLNMGKLTGITEAEYADRLSYIRKYIKKVDAVLAEGDVDYTVAGMAEAKALYDSMKAYVVEDEQLGFEEELQALLDTYPDKTTVIERKRVIEKIESFIVEEGVHTDRERIVAIINQINIYKSQIGYEQMEEDSKAVEASYSFIDYMKGVNYNASYLDKVAFLSGATDLYDVMDVSVEGVDEAIAAYNILEAEIDAINAASEEFIRLVGLIDLNAGRTARYNTIVAAYAAKDAANTAYTGVTDALEVLDNAVNDYNSDVKTINDELEAATNIVNTNTVVNSVKEVAAFIKEYIF